MPVSVQASVQCVCWYVRVCVSVWEDSHKLELSVHTFVRAARQQTLSGIINVSGCHLSVSLCECVRVYECV